MASGFLEALVSALAGGAKTAYGAYTEQQAKQERDAERMRAQTERDRDFDMRNKQFGLQQRAAKFGELDTVFGAAPRGGELAPSAVALSKELGLSLPTSTRMTPGAKTAPITLPGQGFTLPEAPLEGPSPAMAPGLPPPTLNPSTASLRSPVGGQGLGSVRDVTTRPDTAEEQAMDALMRTIDQDQSLSPADRAAMKMIAQGKQAGVNLPAPAPKNRSTLVGNTEGANLIGQTDSFGKPITSANATDRYAIRRQPDGSDEYVPVTPSAASSRITYKTLAGPNGRPTVYAIYADGRPNQAIGEVPARDATFTFVDADGHQRSVYLPAQFSGSGAQERTATDTDVSSPVSTATSSPQTLTPTATEGTGRVLGTVQLPAAMRTAVADLQAVKTMADQAMAAGEAAQWGGVGGFGQGKVNEFLYREAGIGDPKAAEFRNILNNLFGDIAKERGGSALTPAEIQILKSYLPTPNMSVEQIKTNLQGVQRLLQSKLKGYGVDTPEAAPPLVGFEGYERIVGPDGTVRIQKKGGGGGA